MTTNDIDAIRKLTDAATEGPWRAHVGYPQTVWQGSEEDPYIVSTTLARSPDADARFIAAARTHVPALCDEIEQLRAAHDSAIEATAEAESDIDDRDSEISTLKQDLDLQTKAAWDNNAKVAERDAELEKLRAELADVRNQTHRDHTEHQQVLRDKNALAAQVDAMRAVVEQAKHVTATWRFHACIPTADLELVIGEEERKLAEAVDKLPAEIAPNGCDDCSVEPGERHRYFRCPGNGKALLRAEVAS